jgi:hypothetical protein
LTYTTVLIVFDPMAKETLEIGSSPCNEECAQVGSDGYYERAQDECKRFIALIREKIGKEPEGARLFIKSNAHDFGTYYEVAVKFDPEDQAATEYAYRCESDAPRFWDGSRAISQIAEEIERLWKKPYYAAAPYLDAMKALDRIADDYGLDSGADIVSHFLANATTWRGEEARRIKAELNALMGRKK